MDKNGQIHGYYRPYTDRFGRKDKGIKWGILKEENKQMKFLRNGIIWSSIDVYKSLKSTIMRIKNRV